jgi:hypothetical protein
MKPLSWRIIAVMGDKFSFALDRVAIFQSTLPLKIAVKQYFIAHKA